VLQCVAVCCSVLQCVAVCCSVLQCVAVCCSALQCVAVCVAVTIRAEKRIGGSVGRGIKGVEKFWFESISLLRPYVCVAVCCNVLKCVAECC